MNPSLKICPNCGAEVAVLITDCKTQKRFCHNCADKFPGAGLAAKVSKKIHDHTVAGTLDQYLLEERLKDLHSDFHCKRSTGTERAWFNSKEEAERFAQDPTNHPLYLGDVAHLCRRCGYWHLSRPEWLAPEWATLTSENARKIQ